jgi:hypothetical protein
MANERTVDILDRARAFHCKLGDLYRRIRVAGQSERVNLLLDYMSGHEIRLANALTAFERAARPEVLNAWFKNVPDAATPHCLDGVEIGPNMTVDQIIQIAVKSDECLVRLYGSLADRAGSAEVKDLFGKLLAHERKEERIAVRSAQEVEQC